MEEEEIHHTSHDSDALLPLDLLWKCMISEAALGWTYPSVRVYYFMNSKTSHIAEPSRFHREYSTIVPSPDVRSHGICKQSLKRLINRIYACTFNASSTKPSLKQSILSHTGLETHAARQRKKETLHHARSAARTILFPSYFEHEASSWPIRPSSHNRHTATTSQSHAQKTTRHKTTKPVLTQPRKRRNTPGPQDGSWHLIIDLTRGIEILVRCVWALKHLSGFEWMGGPDVVAAQTDPKVIMSETDL